MCGTTFSARSDAVYCSPACRQKAHRSRTAEQIAELRQALKPSPAREKAEALQLSVVKSLQRARTEVDRSRELCRASERHVQAINALRQELARARAADAARMTPTTRAPWPGN